MGFSKDLARMLVIKIYSLSDFPKSVLKYSMKNTAYKECFVFLGSHHSFSKGASTEIQIRIRCERKKDRQDSNNIILSFTELRMNEMSILASQEETCDFFVH